MGAELVNWDQNRVRIDYTNLDYYVDLKPWFHAKVLKNEDLELEHMNIWLPPPSHKYRALTTIAYMDCEGTPMYVSREFKNNNYEIFNHLGQLVATGHPSELVKGQLYFQDENGLPFAIAGSPTIAQVATDIPEWLPQNHLYDFDHWQVWYMAGFNSVTYLKEPDSRWVIAAVVQEHAILNTLIEKGGSVSTPVQYVLCLTLIVLGCLGIASLCLLSCQRIFFMVYPPKRMERSNPWMVEEIGGQVYGSVEVNSKPPAVPTMLPPTSMGGLPFGTMGGKGMPPFGQSFEYGKGMPSMGKGGPP